MRSIFTGVLFSFFTSITLFGQVQNEFRVQTTFLGKTESGLRKFYMAVENNNTGKWKMISKANITTGRNIGLANVVPDSNVSVLQFPDLMKNADFKPLYEEILNAYMDRIDPLDSLAINTEKNETDHKIFKDPGSGNIVVSIKAGQKDTDVTIKICATDNSKMIVLKKSLKQYSGNLVEVRKSILTPGEYIVVASTPVATFSRKFFIL